MDQEIQIIDNSGDDKMLWETIGKPAYEKGLAEGRNEGGLYAIIPMAILENKSLSANAKLLYGEIMALSKKSGKCYATNDHLAEMLGLTDRSIPQLLKELSGIGLVIINIERSSKGTYRDIRVSFFDEGGHRQATMGGVVRQRGQKRNRQIEIDKEKKRENKFSPPSLQDVKNYCDERKNNVKPQSFIDFYESKGWLIGKNKMKSWQAAVRTWEGRDNGSPPKDKKPFFQGNPIVSEFGKRYVIEKGGKMLFTGKESEIIYK